MIYNGVGRFYPPGVVYTKYPPGSAGPQALLSKMVDPCPACRAVLALPNLLRMEPGMRKPPAKPRAVSGFTAARLALAFCTVMGPRACRGLNLIRYGLCSGGPLSCGAARGPCTRAALVGGAHPPGGQDGGGCAAWYPACMATTRIQIAQPDMWQ